MNAEPNTSLIESTNNEPPAGRIRFIEARSRDLPSAQCAVEVELERVDGRRVVGSRSGMPSAIGAIRIAAEAAVEALHLAVAEDQRFDLVGVKSVRAFDQTVVLVLLTTRGPRGVVRLVGAAVGESADAADVTRAAVLAVLNASNRVLVLVRSPEISS
jgi:hypothetical protein